MFAKYWPIFKTFSLQIIEYIITLSCEIEIFEKSLHSLSIRKQKLTFWNDFLLIQFILYFSLYVLTPFNFPPFRSKFLRAALRSRHKFHFHIQFQLCDSAHFQFQSSKTSLHNEITLTQTAQTWWLLCPVSYNKPVVTEQAVTTDPSRPPSTISDQQSHDIQSTIITQWIKHSLPRYEYSCNNNKFA